MEAPSPHGHKDAPPAVGRVVACVECGTEHYWCDFCERAACPHAAHEAILGSRSQNPFPLSAPAASRSVEVLRAFLARVLAGISPDVKVVAFAEIPEARYALRIEIPGEVGKPLVLPKHLVDSATTFPLSLRTLRNILQTETLALHHTRAMSDARQVRARIIREPHPTRNVYPDSPPR